MSDRDDGLRRAQLRHIDGTLIFKSAEDERREAEVAVLLEEAWRCHLQSWGPLAPIDWYAERDDRLVGLVELKCRTHRYGTYPTVFCTIRKWLSMMLASVGLGVPTLYVIAFTDSVYSVPVTMDMGEVKRITGWAQPVGRNDHEPMIEIPLERFRLVCQRLPSTSPDGTA